jgi:hypothetical protein
MVRVESIGDPGRPVRQHVITPYGTTQYRPLGCTCGKHHGQGYQNAELNFHFHFFHNS